MNYNNIIVLKIFFKFGFCTNSFSKAFPSDIVLPDKSSSSNCSPSGAPAKRRNPSSCKRHRRNRNDRSCGWHFNPRDTKAAPDARTVVSVKSSLSIAVLCRNPSINRCSTSCAGALRGLESRVSRSRIDLIKFNSIM